MTRNEFPLTIPPRWLVELFGVLERVVALKMESNRWTLRPSVHLDAESQAFLAAILKNMDMTSVVASDSMSLHRRGIQKP